MHEMDTVTFVARGVTYGHNEISYRIATTVHCSEMHEMDTAAYLARGVFYSSNFFITFTTNIKIKLKPTRDKKGFVSYTITCYCKDCL